LELIKNQLFSWLKTSKTPTILSIGVVFGFILSRYWDHLSTDPVPQQLVLTLPKEVKAENGIAKISFTSQGDTIKWQVPSGVKEFSEPLANKNIKIFLVDPTKPARYTVRAYTATVTGWFFWPKGLPSDMESCDIVVGDSPPGPNPPNPPTPPVPPTPPAPIPVAGLRVLVVYDVTKPLSTAQREILTSTAVRTYLNSVCVKGVDGKTPEYRFWDQGVDTSNETDLWKQVMQRPRQQIPWIVISNGKTGFEGSLPGSVSDFQKKIQEFQTAPSTSLPQSFLPKFNSRTTLVQIRGEVCQK
jgi:hypothetical protein